MPVVLLKALGDQLPRVRATESLRRAAEVALGSGTLKKEDARELHARWTKQAEGGRSGSRRANWLENFKKFEAMGIAVEITKAPPHD